MLRSPPYLMRIAVHPYLYSGGEEWQDSASPVNAAAIPVVEIGFAGMVAWSVHRV